MIVLQTESDASQQTAVHNQPASEIFHVKYPGMIQCLMEKQRCYHAAAWFITGACTDGSVCPLMYLDECQSRSGEARLKGKC